MVTVAQLVESRIVIPVVVGSSPISHPKFSNKNSSLAQPCADRIGYIRTEKEKLAFSVRTIPTFRILIPPQKNKSWKCDSKLCLALCQDNSRIVPAEAMHSLPIGHLLIP